MPIDPNHESAVRERVEREFAELERASAEAGAGVLDVLQVYGGFELALRQANDYLALLNPTLTNFSTTNSANIQR